MRLFHRGNCLTRFLKLHRISQKQYEGLLGSVGLTTTTTGSPCYSKCKHSGGTCFGLTTPNNQCLLFHKWKTTTTSNYLFNFSTGQTDDLSKDTIVKDILKDIKDDFAQEFKSCVDEEETTHEEQKAEMENEDEINKNPEFSEPLRVSSSSNLVEIRDNDGIIGTKDFHYSSSSTNKEIEELLTEQEDDDEIEDFIDYGYMIEDEEEDIDVQVYTPPIELKRGTTGVFDIQDLVTVLEDENGIDICVIDVPESKNYVDYMVIVSGKSARHIRSMAENIKWLYKQKKTKRDPYVQIEGLNTNNWLAMDLGNIALHIFLPQIREKYDLETLWTIGDVADETGGLEFDDPYAMKELPLQTTNEEEQKEEIIEDKEANNVSAELKRNENTDQIQNLSNKN